MSSSTPNKTLILTLLQKMSEKKIPQTKIAIHKVFYFLKAFGVPLPMRFEPYTYGPYSFGLASDLNDMIFWDVLAEDVNKIVAKEEPSGEFEPGILKLIDETLNKFVEASGGDYTFGNLELLGTVLYCLRTLESEQSELEDEDILTLFRQWKDDKFDDEAIINTSGKLKSIQ